MRDQRGAVLIVLLVIAALVSTGCVTKKNYRDDTEKTNARINSAESGIEANERRIADLGKETDSAIEAVRARADEAAATGEDALARADEASKLADKAARGKLLWTVTLSDDNLKFEFGQAGITESAAETLDELIAQIKAYDRAVYILIEGYTDNIGNDVFNQKLGMQRAAAVRDYLFEKGGIPLHAIDTYSYGMESPVADNSTPEGRAQNRRVVIKVLQ